MRKFLFMCMTALLLASAMTSCQMKGVDGGEEMVIIQKPWFFGSGGVVDEPAVAGRHWLALSTDYEIYNIKPVKYEESFDDVITYDNNPVDFSAYIQLQILSGETPRLHESFGKNWYKNNVEDQFRAKVRNKCSQYKMFTLSTDRKIVDSLEVAIFNEMVAYVESIDLPVDVQQVIIGKVTPPKAVLDETTKTAAATQSIKTQDARKNAELARMAADSAKAEADMAYKNNFDGMTINQYLWLRQLEIEKEKIDMVKGKDKVSIIMQSGSGGSPTPTIPLK